MDWKVLPYQHAGRWEAKFDSIMNPTGNKITWPQYIVELIINNRIKYIKTYPKITKGVGWSNAIAKQVRSLAQQAYCIVNYFPHIDDNKLVEVAIKLFITNRRVCKIGQFRKNRTNKNGGITITQDEKDFVLGVNAELEAISKKVPTQAKSEPTKVVEIDKGYVAPKIEVQKSKINKKSIFSIMALEEKIKA